MSGVPDPRASVSRADERFIPRLAGTLMSETNLRNALALLQDDPENQDAWTALDSALRGADRSEAKSLVAAARRAHESRREFEAVAKLLAHEVELAKGGSDEVARLEDLARVLDLEVLDETATAHAWARLLELAPAHTEALEALERSEVKRSKWTELVSRYRDEAKGAQDPSLRASLLVSAAEIAYRYGKPALDGTAGKSQPKKLEALLQKVVGELTKALEFDPKNRRALMLLERVHRFLGDFTAVAETLERAATEAPGRDEKVASLLRLGRIYRRRLRQDDRAASAYERVLDLHPGHEEATSALVDLFTAKEEWDRLAALYEEQLAGGNLSAAQEGALLLQVAMVHWKMRGNAEAAEPYFERLRKVEPGHPGLVGFFREWCEKKGEKARFAQVLADAVRATSDAGARAALQTELAGMADEGANAARSIEQWKAILRQDPSNKAARDTLKKLYRETAQHAPLADVLRGELERTPADAKDTRLPILRELADLYRQHIKNDAALVTILMQISNFDHTDVAALRDLARVYEALGRFRDLLTVQMKLAEVEASTGIKAELYRSVGRRWLDQFSNVQNAVEAFEKLLAVLPGDPEAVAKLKELYTKRRAYKQLFDLESAEAERLAPGPERRAVLTDLAKLAAERLDRSSDAIRIYRQVLHEEPTDAGAMDALEKLAERDKDWKALAEVLELRVDMRGETAQKLQTLQKLGAVYSDRLGSPEGALKAWRRVLELSPGNAKAVRVLRDAYLAARDYDALTEMYSVTSDWEGLAEVLSGAADKAGDEDTKVDLSFRAADVYASRIGNPERAFRAYERVLGVRPNDRRAASALVPIYEKEEKWARLPALYEVLLGHATSDEDKRVLLDKLVKVTGSQLVDKAAAFDYARRAYVLDRESPDALTKLERAAKAAGDFESFATVLRGEIGASEGARRRTIKRKLADVLATELERLDDAVVEYRDLVTEDPSDESTVETFEGVLRGAGRKDDLRALFELRIGRADDARKIAILRDWATLEEEVFESPSDAIAIYRRVLDAAPEDRGAIRALARLLRSSGDAQGAVDALMKERDRSEGKERARLEVDIARLELSLKRPAAALDAAKRALEAAPADEAARSLVEELLSVADTRSAAASLLDEIYGAQGAYAKQADMLEVLVATAPSKADRLELYQRLAAVREERLSDVGAAYDTVVRAVSEFPSELSLWDRLSVLANRGRRTKAFVETLVAALPESGESGLPAKVELDLAERLATLLVESLGDSTRAKPYLARILEKDPTNERAFLRLKQILTQGEDWTALERLYERAVDAAGETSQKASLLAEIALVAEEITGDKARAIAHYRRILEIEPEHEQAARALDSLYTGQGEWASLVELLTARLSRAVGEDALQIKQRIGVLTYERLDQPERALALLEEVLSADPLAEDAREVAERCLANPALRARAANVLEQVYVAQDKARDLVRILEIRLETEQGSAERRELLRRIAELRDERINEGAFEAYARLVPAAPDDAHARARLIELAPKVGAWEEAARVLTDAAKAATTPQPRAEILSEVARIYEDHLGARERAEGVYLEVLEIDPDDATLALPAAKALERLYVESGQNAELVKILRVQVKLEDNTDVRRALFGRIGVLSENMLDDARGAIEAWRTRLEEDPVDEEALHALDRLYEPAGEWRPLVDVLRARERRADGESARRALMERIADTLATRIGDTGEAILAYRALVDELGPEKSWLTALESLYEKEEKWNELAETLETELSRADQDGDRLAVLARLGRVRKGHLSDLAGALEAYRQALDVDATHAPSREALEALLDDKDGRREAASILKPIYQREGAAASLLRTLDIEVEYEDTPDGKLRVFGEAEEVAESALSDASRAFGYASRALAVAAAEPELPRWLAIGDRLSDALSRHAEYVELLRKVLADVTDEDQSLELSLKIAGLAQARLSDEGLARTYYVKALEIREGEPRALEALEGIYERGGDAPQLLDVLKKRAEAAPTDSARVKLLAREARLLEESLKDSAAAIDVHQTIIDIAPEAESYSALERLLAAAERWDDLVALYERQIGLGPAAERRAMLHYELGKVLEGKLGDFERTFDQYEQALRLDPQHGPTVAALASLMERPEHAFRAATMLEDVYLARLDWRKVMETIEARLAVCDDAGERVHLLRRLAKLHEEQEENYSAALDATAKLLGENIADEETWEELERLSRVANAEARLGEIYAAELAKKTEDDASTAKLSMRTGQIFAAQKDLERALAFYRRALAFDPESAEAFTAVDRALIELARPADRAALYRASLEYKNDPPARLDTLHTIAGIEEDALHDDAGAINTHRAALEVEETDGTSLDALSRLYRRAQRWSDLADLFRRRAEMSAVPDEEAAFRLELARVLETNLSDEPGAIGEYQNVVEVASSSTHATDAVRSLERLLEKAEHKARIVAILAPIYESSADWKRLVTIAGEKLRIAETDSERVSVLRETARLWEDQGKDLQKAFESMRDAFVLDPEDGESRAELDRLAEATKRWDDLAAAYERGIERTEGVAKKELLTALATLHDKRRDDPRRALDAWDRLFQLDESDLAPLDEMDALATLLSDWSVLVRVLAKRAELIADDEERASSWRRIGEARRDMLDDAHGAIQAYERALEIEPESAYTIDNLIPLYEDKNDAARLVDLYRRRIELSGEDDEGLKFELHLAAAQRYETGLNDRREAIRELALAHEVKPGERDVVRRLGELYAAERLFPDLLENLKLQAAEETDAAARLALKKRIGALLSHELDDGPAAVEAYRDVLDSGYDAEAVQALRELGQKREELRADVVDVLEPVLRAASRHQELADVLEMRLDADSDPHARATTLREIARLAGSEVGDWERAEKALLRALGEEPVNPDVHTDLEAVAERRGTESFRRYADALAERAGATLEAPVAAELYSRLGAIAENKLEEHERAARAYASAADQGGDNDTVLAALDRLYGRIGDARALAGVLERRVSLGEEPAKQAELLHRLGSLQQKEFGDAATALATFRTALDRFAEHEPSRLSLEALLDDKALFADAAEALESVYRATNRSAELASLFERRVERAEGGDRIRMRLDLARVLEEMVGDARRAQRTLEAALREDPTDPDVLSEVERLAPTTDGWKDAEAALAEGLAKAESLSGTGRSELWAKLATWRRDRLADPRGAESAFVEALSTDSENGELLRQLEDLRRAPGRERELIETLRTRTKLEHDPSDRRALLKEAKELAEGALQDSALAESCLRDLLAEDEGDAWGLEELARLREAAGDVKEVAELLSRLAHVEADAEKVAAVRHRLGRLLAHKLEDSPRAIKVYEVLVEERPADTEAAVELRRLYTEGGRQRDLVELLRKLVDRAESKDDRVKLRLDLAKLEETLGERTQAADTYRDLLGEEPDHNEAVLALSELLEKDGRDEELADLMSAQIARAKERGDTAAELSLEVRLGQMFETRLKDPDRALQAFESVLSREPKHEGALSAVARLNEERGDLAGAERALAALVDLASGQAGVDLALRLADTRSKMGELSGEEAALRRAIGFDGEARKPRERLRELLSKDGRHADLAAAMVDEADFITQKHPDVVVAAPAPAAPETRGSMRPAGASAPPPPPVAEPVAQVLKLLRGAADVHIKEREAPADAIPLLERAATLVPHDRELLLLLCDTLVKLSREREAAVVLERIIASFGGRRTKELSLYHHRLGQTLAKLGDRAAALEQFDMAFRIDPGSVSVLRDLGVLALETDDLDRAQKSFRALLLQRLDDASGISKGEVFFYLGEISAKQGDRTKAVQMFERAVESEPNLERAKSRLSELKSS